MSDQSSSSSKKRKQVSEAEKLALELSKLTSKQVHQSKVKFENNQIIFLESSKSPFTNACTWKDDKLWPRYCKKAEFKFEAYLPDRKYLTRYSVNCSTCYDGGDTAVHLYCSYCDEILTGSIAGPGGKITDHLITIRHVYQEAIALSTYFEQKGWSREQEYQPAREYVKKLEEWSETIRYPKNSLKKADFEDVIRSLRVQLSRVSAGPSVGDAAAEAHMEGEVKQEARVDVGGCSASPMFAMAGYPFAQHAADRLGSSGHAAGDHDGYFGRPDGGYGAGAGGPGPGFDPGEDLYHYSRREGWQLGGPDSDLSERRRQPAADPLYLYGPGQTRGQPTRTESHGYALGGGGFGGDGYGGLAGPDPAQREPVERGGTARPAGLPGLAGRHLSQAVEPDPFAAGPGAAGEPESFALHDAGAPAAAGDGAAGGYYGQRAAEPEPAQAQPYGSRRPRGEPGQPGFRPDPTSLLQPGMESPSRPSPCHRCPTCWRCLAHTDVFCPFDSAEPRGQR